MRIGAVAAKEFWALVRQPQLLLLLLVGPVLIMTAFGLSLDVRDILRPRALVVVKPGSEGAELFERYREEFTDRTQFVGTTGDLESARRRLQRGEVDAVITIPPDPLGTVASGERTPLGVVYNTINPVFGTRVPARAYALVLDLNQSLIETTIGGEIGNLRTIQERLNELDRRLEEASAAAEELASEEAQTVTTELDEALATLEGSLGALEESEAVEGDVSETLRGINDAQNVLGEVREVQREGTIGERSGLTDLRESVNSAQEALAALPDDVSPQVLTNPFRLETENLATPPDVVGFYARGVLAILVQHISVSLASLAVVRERLSGAYEFFEVSPLRPGELLAGQFLTYLGLVLGVNLAVAAVLAGFLGVPVEGGYLRMAFAMVLLTVASLGLGFLISALAKSQLQAVQVSMLLLIASGFFAGFLFPLSEMRGPGVLVSNFLPATYGIRALQDVMIRGETVSTYDLAGLGAMAIVALGAARFFVGRRKH
ncbi:ABC transporter permease [Rubrobacter marinus]|uniref:ABC transporter permease n=1 Tax=Rubrobacter marinus TaxID=2653852 RepID=UPI0014076F7B|nr:ABC transporter permease [Rubrobacter marinus]